MELHQGNSESDLIGVVERPRILGAIIGGVVLSTCFFAATSFAQVNVLWDEARDGELTDATLSPIRLGANETRGSLQRTGNQRADRDTAQFDIPRDLRLDQFLLASFDSQFLPTLALNEGPIDDATTLVSVNSGRPPIDLLGLRRPALGSQPPGTYSFSITDSLARGAGQYVLRAVTKLQGDLNDDGLLDDSDLEFLNRNFLSRGTNYAQGDLSGDGQTDFEDLLVFRALTNELQPRASRPEFLYDPQTGELSVRPNGIDMIGFKLNLFEATKIDATSTGLPDSWHVAQVGNSIQAYDTSVLLGKAPNSLNPNSPAVGIGKLAAPPNVDPSCVHVSGVLYRMLPLPGGNPCPEDAVVINAGDFDFDGDLDTDDVNLLLQQIANGGPYEIFYELTADDSVDEEDLTKWVKELKTTWFGDADLDGEFNSNDLVLVFAAGKYESGQMAGWEEGDWDANLLFDTSDLVAAFGDGGYEKGPQPGAVPEPSGVSLAIVGLAMITILRGRCRVTHATITLRKSGQKEPVPALPSVRACN